MSTYTKVSDTFTVIRRRQWSLPCYWRDPDGVAIDITDFTVTAEVAWQKSEAMPVVVTVTDAVAGAFEIASVGLVPDTFPLGALAELTVTLVDQAGDSSDFDITLIGVDP